VWIRVPDIPTWAWIVFVLPVTLLVVLFVRWWWTHAILERLDRIASALERQSPIPREPPIPQDPAGIPAPVGSDMHWGWIAFMTFGLIVLTIVLAWGI
jgi:hypothetical protein